MGQTIEILGIRFDVTTLNETLEIIKEYIKKESLKMIFTPNPEVVMVANKDQEFMDIINKSDLNIADGIGIVIASKILGNPLPERVTGFDTISNLFKIGFDGSISFYFLGGEPGIVEKARDNLRLQYPDINIVGTHHGYFNKDEEINIINDINERCPDILVVGLGMGRQERWIFAHKNELKAKVCMGLGGSLDHIAGKMKRAPKIFQKLGLEWFYRLLRYPTRIKRMLNLPLFALKVLECRIKGK